MSQILEQMSWEIYDSATSYAMRCVNEWDVDKKDLWKYMGCFINEARREYSKRFVDWFQPRHVRQAMHELAESIIYDLWEED